MECPVSSVRSWEIKIDSSPILLAELFWIVGRSYENPFHVMYLTSLRTSRDHAHIARKPGISGTNGLRAHTGTLGALIVVRWTMERQTFGWMRRMIERWDLILMVTWKRERGWISAEGPVQKETSDHHSDWQWGWRGSWDVNGFQKGFVWTNDAEET